MKILAFVDMHGSSKAFKKVKEKAKKADIIVCAGDISIFENGLDKLLEKLAKLKKKILIIPGNHEGYLDLRLLSKRFDNIIEIHEKSHIEGEYLFLGYGGGGFSMVDKHFNKIAKRFEKKIKKNKGKKVILITHAPPYKTEIDKIMDEPCGNKTIKNFVLKVKPDLVVSGHLHETAGKEDKIGKIKLINPGPYGKVVSV